MAVQCAPFPHNCTQKLWIGHAREKREENDLELLLTRHVFIRKSLIYSCYVGPVFRLRPSFVSVATLFALAFTSTASTFDIPHPPRPTSTQGSSARSIFQAPLDFIYITHDLWTGCQRIKPTDDSQPLGFHVFQISTRAVIASRLDHFISHLLPCRR